MKQSKRINFWLGEKDLAKLDRLANEAKLTRSEYIRKLVCEAKILPTPDVDYLAYADEFQRLGTLLQRLRERVPFDRRTRSGPRRSGLVRDQRKGGPAAERTDRENGRSESGGAAW